MNDQSFTEFVMIGMYQFTRATITQYWVAYKTTEFYFLAVLEAGHPRSIYYLPMSESTLSSNPQLERISLQLLALSAKQQEADSSFYRNLMEYMALAV